MNNITLLVAMAVAALSGYFVGSYSRRDAKEALATAQIAARHAQDEYENTVKVLNERIGKLDSEYAEEKKDNTAHFRKQQQKWADLLASRDRRIVELSGMNNATAAEISRLRTSLQDMPPLGRAQANGAAHSRSGKGFYRAANADCRPGVQQDSGCK